MAVEVTIGHIAALADVSGMTVCNDRCAFAAVARQAIKLARLGADQAIRSKSP